MSISIDFDKRDTRGVESEHVFLLRIDCMNVFHSRVVRTFRQIIRVICANTCVRKAVIVCIAFKCLTAYPHVDAAQAE